MNINPTILDATGRERYLIGGTQSWKQPYHQYAWPLPYEIAVTDEPVAIGVWGQRAIILTKGDPVLVAGSSPDSMDDEPAAINRPCSSARSVVSFNEGDTAKGVAWASEEGLCWYGDGGFRLLTKHLLTREQWQVLAPSTMIAARLEQFYLCFYNDGSRKGFVIDPMDPSGIYYLSTGYQGVYRDPRTDRVYVLDGANIRRWGAGSALTATFKSKLLRQAMPLNIGAIEVIAKGYPVNVKLYGDGVLRLTQDAPSDDTLRPPGGWEADELQVEVSSSSRVIAVRLARNPDELLEP